MDNLGTPGGGLRRSDGELGTTLEWGYAAVWVILGHWGRTPQCWQTGQTGGVAVRFPTDLRVFWVARGVYLPIPRTDSFALQLSVSNRVSSLAPPSPLMAAQAVGVARDAAGADLGQQLSALLGRPVKRQIRKTGEDPPRVSIIDTVMVVTGVNAQCAAKTFRRVQERYPTVTPFLGEWKFPGSRQKMTPVTHARGNEEANESRSTYEINPSTLTPLRKRNFMELCEARPGLAVFAAASVRPVR